jgi:hypothetical protein
VKIGAVVMLLIVGISVSSHAESPSTAYVIPTEKNIAKMMSHHFWTESLFTIFSYCEPDAFCDFLTIPKGTGFTVIGFARSKKYPTLLMSVRVKLDDGRIGFLDLGSSGPWETDTGRASAVSAAAQLQAFCQNAPVVSLGMTEEQASSSKWGNPEDVNTTETANGIHKQWVRSSGPLCDEDGTVARGGKTSYLYFDNGHLVAIQR